MEKYLEYKNLEIYPGEKNVDSVFLSAQFPYIVFGYHNGIIKVKYSNSIFSTRYIMRSVIMDGSLISFHISCRLSTLFSIQILGYSCQDVLKEKLICGVWRYILSEGFFSDSPFNYYSLSH